MMKVTSTALALYLSLSSWSSSSRTEHCSCSSTTIVSAFQIPFVSTTTAATRHNTRSTFLRYRDDSYSGSSSSSSNGPEVDLYEPVTAEVLRPDVRIPHEAKKAYVVNEDEEDQQGASSGTSTTTTTHEPPSVWETSKVKTIEGGCLKTWTMDIPEVDHVQLLLKNDGTPLNAKADVYCGPGNAPMQLAVYSDDGARHPFSGVICTPYMVSHSIGVQNSGSIDEHPLKSVVLADMEHIYGDRRSGSSSNFTPDGNLQSLAHDLLQFGTVRRIQGGDDEVFAFHKPVESVQILLKTDGRPCQARIELSSDSDNIAQVVEVYSEDGAARPFFAVLDTPGLSNMVRVVNVGDPAFPISACVEPFTVDADFTRSSDTSTTTQGVQEIGVVTGNGGEESPQQDTMYSYPPPPSPGPIPVDPFVPGGDIGIPGIEDDVGFFFVD